MAKAIHSAKVSDETVGKVLQIWLGSRKDQRMDQREIIRAMNEKGMYGEASSFLSQKTDEQVKSLSGTQLLSDLSKMMQYQAKVIYTGTLSQEAVSTAVKETIFKQDKSTALADYEPRPMTSPAGTKIQFYHKEMAQAQVLIQFAGQPRDENDLAVIEVFNNYFGLGMNSILFQELREDNRTEWDDSPKPEVEHPNPRTREEKPRQTNEHASGT